MSKQSGPEEMQKVLRIYYNREKCTVSMEWGENISGNKHNIWFKENGLTSKLSVVEPIGLFPLLGIMRNVTGYSFVRQGDVNGYIIYEREHDPE